jgi:hypothetical protein
MLCLSKKIMSMLAISVTATVFILCAMSSRNTMAGPEDAGPEHPGLKHGLIDDRSSRDSTSTIGSKWRLATDHVMGGVSRGELVLDHYQGRDCLRLRGKVSTENNGGFIQMSLSLSADGDFDASAWSGIEMEVAGNNESYNLHLRTSDLWLPWQSYRSAFPADNHWQTHRIPFSKVQPYKTSRRFAKNKITRLGLVAIGREFNADLCLAAIRFYR